MPSTPATRVLLEDALRAQERLEFNNPEGLREASDPFRKTSAHECHPAIRVEPADLFRQLQPVHAGHVEVREDEIALRLSTDLQRLTARRAGLDARAGQKKAHNLDDELGHGRLVVDDQDEQSVLPRPDLPVGA